jgi:hypothetical protein
MAALDLSIDGQCSARSEKTAENSDWIVISRACLVVQRTLCEHHHFHWHVVGRLA